MRTICLSTLVLLTACDGGGGEPIGCTDIAIGSVTLTVVDPSGVAVVPDKVTFTIDGGPEREPLDCFESPECSEFVLTYEEAGVFDVTAELCGQEATGSVTVGMTEDGCHVVPQTLELVLDPADCPTGAVSVSYDWAGYYDAAETCGDAWTDTLYAYLSHEFGPTDVVSAECDDTPFLIEDLPVGSWRIQLANVEDTTGVDGPFAASETVTVEVVAGETTETAVTLTCDENGWDDGCGGA